MQSLGRKGQREERREGGREGEREGQRTRCMAEAEAASVMVANPQIKIGGAAARVFGREEEEEEVTEEGESREEEAEEDDGWGGGVSAMKNSMSFPLTVSICPPHKSVVTCTSLNRCAACEYKIHAHKHKQAHVRARRHTHTHTHAFKHSKDADGCKKHQDKA
jgi:hypothetical protein